ncbi:MAG: sugar ABC transporter ATP-binding protein [Candidatus Pacebacteria bacterium CG10_big_fil_rev_8_21_14_0_10_56_10]|nr:MAG: sugar ABC transporter ATP-binding protein [Candidatus Pacebacteria bacterium CG10_big_fil_rev_8_21_14_0_10_56_10]
MKPVVTKFSQVTKIYPVQQERTLKDVIPQLLRLKPWAVPQASLKDVSFEINQGESVGIVGRNGAGKSTTLKLIAGVTYPTQGSLEVTGRIAPLIELTAGFHHELNGFENIFLNGAILGMSRREIEAKVTQIVDFSELHDYMYQPVKRYSTGMFMRLGFSIAVHTSADILLIDEVLAVGDDYFQQKSLDRLEKIRQDGQVTTVFVSHDQRSVERFCDRSLLLVDGQLVAAGPPAQIFKQYHRLPNKSF